MIPPQNLKRGEVSDETLIEAVEASKRYTSRTDAANALGVARTTFTGRLNLAAKRGLMGYGSVLPGFEIKQTSEQRDAAGHIQKQWIQQRPEAGEPFELPPWHRIKGVSALLDEQGKVRAQWVKTSAEEEARDHLISAIKAEFDEYKGRSILVPPPTVSNADLLTVYPIGDMHIGMLSWKKETGEDFDLKIAERVLLSTMESVVAGAPNSSIGLVLGMGDWTHNDNHRNMTERSGNILDVDSRYAHVLRVAIRLSIRCIELALERHEKVLARFLPGNHDPMSALAITAALGAFFHNNPRVTVDDDPSLFFKYVFGKCLITATHGHTIKPERMPGLVASKWPKDWGDSLWRVAWLGHVHHKNKGGGEVDGMVWETVQVLPPVDAYHSSHGYGANRSLMAVTYHREYGETDRKTVSVVPASA